jgi:hypothetical protein
VRCAAICFAFLVFTAQGVSAQAPLPGGRQAPIGHRQPTPGDLPPDVRKEEEPGAKPWPTTQPQAQSQPQTQPKQTQSRSRQQSARVRGGGGGGPPVLQVGPSCEAAGRGAVVLGRNKEACLADENQALATLKQNWSKYVASDKTLCMGMVSTGGPASYVELLSCLEINRDARDIQNADPLDADLNSPPSTTTGSASTEPRRKRRW